MSVAIIGSGISGLSCAYHLHNDFNVTVYEKEERLGGHTDTHEFQIEKKKLRIDSGFIIFCRDYYPHFCAMLDDLNVESQSTNMSFSVHNRNTGVIYNATSLNALFCQRKNLINPSFYRMLIDLLRFYLTANKNLRRLNPNKTVEEYLKEYKYGQRFAQDHLYPMISALWSTPPSKVKDYPIQHLVDFMSNHGLLKIFSRPEWRVIKNGSKSYIEAIQSRVKCNWLLNCPALKVERTHKGVKITSTQGQHFYDKVIFATHPDQTLKIISKNASDSERRILGAIRYEKNHVVVHTDESVMHSNSLSWASWNAEVPSEYKPNTLECCTANYWMNSLQGLQCETNIFTSLNSHQFINPNKILAERHYMHPIFTPESVTALKQNALLNGKNNSYFVGAYWGWGFHEDGARSAAEACQKIKSIYRS